MPNEDDLTELQVESDEALFDSATADAPADTPETAEAPESGVAAETTAQPRDESGRFAPKAGDQPTADATAAAAPPTDDAKDGMVPSWRLREVREAGETAVQQLRREIDELKRTPPQSVEPPKAKEPPDPLIDPEGYRAHMRTEWNDMLQAKAGEISLRYARKSDPELFEKAYAAAKSASAADVLRIKNSPDPGDELLAWFRERETVREVGSDPAAYKQRLLDEALKDPAFLAKAVAASRTPAPANVTGIRQPSPVRLPPSLSAVTPSGAARGNPDDDDISDEGLFAHATAGMR